MNSRLSNILSLVATVVLTTLFLVAVLAHSIFVPLAASTAGLLTVLDWKFVFFFLEIAFFMTLFKWWWKL